MNINDLATAIGPAFTATATHAVAVMPSGFYVRVQEIRGGFRAVLHQAPRFKHAAGAEVETVVGATPRAAVDALVKTASAGAVEFGADFLVTELAAI